MHSAASENKRMDSSLNMDDGFIKSRHPVEKRGPEFFWMPGPSSRSCIGVQDDGSGTGLPVRCTCLRATHRQTQTGMTKRQKKP
ncbi:MAG: hypothetical protein JXA79_13290 [Deltaproteobacteria bacterium]|nr:hypothetical protein [Deltaproteobacteria bacterium]